MGVDIPEESPWGPVPDTVRVEFVDSGEITPELTVGLLADIKQVQRERDAAIARAAQVRILRDLADELKKEAARDREFEKGREAPGLFLAETWTRIKANELEQPTPTKESP